MSRILLWINQGSIKSWIERSREITVWTEWLNELATVIQLWKGNKWRHVAKVDSQTEVQTQDRQFMRSLQLTRKFHIIFQSIFWWHHDQLFKADCREFKLTFYPKKLDFRNFCSSKPNRVDLRPQKSRFGCSNDYCNLNPTSPAQFESICNTLKHQSTCKSRQTFLLVKTRLNWNVKNTQSEVELIEVGTDWNVRHSWGFKRGFPNLQEPMIANHVRIKMSHLNDVGVGSEITKTFMKLKWWNLRNFLKKRNLHFFAENCRKLLTFQ